MRVSLKNCNEVSIGGCVLITRMPKEFRPIIRRRKRFCYFETPTLFRCKELSNRNLPASENRKIRQIKRAFLFSSYVQFPPRHSASHISADLLDLSLKSSPSFRGFKRIFYESRHFEAQRRFRLGTSKILQRPHIKRLVVRSFHWEALRSRNVYIVRRQTFALFKQCIRILAVSNTKTVSRPLSSPDIVDVQLIVTLRSQCRFSWFLLEGFYCKVSTKVSNRNLLFLYLTSKLLAAT